MKKTTRQMYVDHVIDFLNSESPGNFLKGSGKHAKRFQERLRNEIENALTPPRKTALQTLVRQLERAGAVLPLDFDVTGPGDTRTVLDFGDEKFALARKRAKTKQQEMRSYVYLTIQSGQFVFIHKCRQCPKFFPSYRHGAKACSLECNRDFHNDEGQRTGYFADNYKKKKRKKLNEARELTKKHFPRDQIIEKTGLTEKMLIREGILDAS